MDNKMTAKHYIQLCLILTIFLVIMAISEAYR